MNLGTLIDGLGCFPFDHGAYPPQSDCLPYTHEIRILIAISTAWNGHRTVSDLPSHAIANASPKAISGRTSYLPTRLEFLPYPQVIHGRFNERWFGPPVGFTPPSTCSWIDRRVSGLLPHTIALFRLAFTTAPSLRLNQAWKSNSPVHSSIGTPSPFNGLWLFVSI